MTQQLSSEDVVVAGSRTYEHTQADRKQQRERCSFTDWRIEMDRSYSIGHGRGKFWVAAGA